MHIYTYECEVCGQQYEEHGSDDASPIRAFSCIKCQEPQLFYLVEHQEINSGDL